MKRARKQPSWKPVVAKDCACSRCKDCQAQARRVSIARAYERLFIGCDTARPDRADEVLVLTAA